MSKADIPPVPPAARSDKGPGDSSASKNRSDVDVRGNRPVPANADKQGRQGNIKQNTTNQGYQQDR